MTHVVALFDHRDDARRAIEDLVAHGIVRERISVVASGTAQELEESGLAQAGAMVVEGAATGLAAGALVGGVIGLLAGAGIGFVPAGIAIAGPLSGLLAGGAAGAATGGIFGGLIGLGIPDAHAKAYDESIRAGGAVVAVEANDEDVEQIEAILDRDGAVDIVERAGFAGDSNDRPRVARYVRQDPPRKDAAIPDGRLEVNAEDQPEPYQELFQAEIGGSAREEEVDDSPAYLFGYAAAKRDEFEGRDWSVAEPVLRSEWEDREAGSWEANRGEVLRGWNSCHAKITTVAELL